MSQSLAQADAQFFSSAWSASVNSPQVWCTFAQSLAFTNDGFCQFCGSTGHATLEDAARHLEDA